MTAATASIAAGEDLDDLRRRVRSTRRPLVPGRDGWTRGVDGAFLDAPPGPAEQSCG